jgi:hypothetical protein
MFSLSLAASLSSCVVMHERYSEEQSATYAALGGKGAYKIGGGVVYNNEKSFRDATVAAGVVATGYFGAVASKATEATKQVALQEATKKAASDNALKAQAIEANAAAHGQAISAELPGVVPAAPPVAPILPP